MRILTMNSKCDIVVFELFNFCRAFAFFYVSRKATFIVMGFIFCVCGAGMADVGFFELGPVMDFFAGECDFLGSRKLALLSIILSSIALIMFVLKQSSAGSCDFS